MDEGPDNKFMIEEGEPIRCAWCGIPESDRWIPDKFGRYYCSYKCVRVESYTPNCSTGCTIGIIATVIVAAVPLLLAGILWFIGAVVLAIIFINCFRRLEMDLKSILKERPKDSRKYSIMLREKTVLTACPKCGANLDLDMEKSEYECEYCGTSGLIEIIIDMEDA